MIRDGDEPCYACDVEREDGDRVDAHAQELPVGIGAVGLVLSIVFWSSWGGFGGADRAGSSTTVVKH